MDGGLHVGPRPGPGGGERAVQKPPPEEEADAPVDRLGPSLVGTLVVAKREQGPRRRRLPRLAGPGTVLALPEHEVPRRHFGRLKRPERPRQDLAFLRRLRHRVGRIRGGVLREGGKGEGEEEESFHCRGLRRIIRFSRGDLLGRRRERRFIAGGGGVKGSG